MSHQHFTCPRIDTKTGSRSPLGVASQLLTDENAFMTDTHVVFTRGCSDELQKESLRFMNSRRCLVEFQSLIGEPKRVFLCVFVGGSSLGCGFTVSVFFS